jgi:pyrimidine operon attenuation protein/uracil phosphoribosyltransferase
MQEVLTKTQIDQKINRLAHQIIEDSYGIQEIFLAGICGTGLLLAKKIASILRESTEQEIHVFEIKLNKVNPLSESIEISIEQKKLTDGFIILIDDVLNSGKTMQYGLIKLLEQPVKAIKTAALVDRRHRRFPIKCDYVGITLSTTLKERVEIEFPAENEYRAVLR